jgi:predicted nucleic acid-binding protein
MIYLLDTNVICETIKPSPNKQVLEWLDSIDAHNFSLSVLTLGEIRKGIEKHHDQVRKQKIIRWLEGDIIKRFYGRIINIDAAVADKWGYLSARATMPVADSIIAASAIVYNHKLVTRNVKDFQAIIGLEIINPWEL